MTAGIGKQRSPLGGLTRQLRSTRGRLTLMGVAILAIGLALANLGLYTLFSLSQQDEVNAQIKDQAAQVARGLEVSSGHVHYRAGALSDETSGGIIEDQALVGDGGVIASGRDTTLPPATLVTMAQPVLSTGQAVWARTVHKGHLALRLYVIPIRPQHGPLVALIVTVPASEVAGPVARATAMVGVLSAITLVGAGLLTYWLIGRVLRPVGRIAKLADSLSEHQLHRRVEVRAPDDELGELVSTFNRMLERLERSFEGLHHFTADAAHELKAPLSLMAVELELALARPRPQPEYERALRLLRAEVRHMSGLAGTLLLLSSVDAGQLRPDVGRVDVADFLHETVARWSTTARRRSVEIGVVAPDVGVVMADRNLTTRALDNLIDNALRHCRPGGRVEVRARPGNAEWIFEVADQGPGVPIEQRDHIFARFARGDAARTPDGEHRTGLGLPLSEAIAAAQGGSLRLVDAAGWGAVFELRLPLAPSAWSESDGGIEEASRRSAGVR